MGARLYTWMFTSYNFSNSSSSLSFTPWNFFFPTQRLGTADNSVSCPALNFWCGSHYGGPNSGRNRFTRVAIVFQRVDSSVLGDITWKIFATADQVFANFHTNYVTFVTRSTPHLLFGRFGEPTPGNRCCWFLHTSALSLRDWRPGKAVPRLGCYWQTGDGTGGPQSLYYAE